MAHPMQKVPFGALSPIQCFPVSTRGCDNQADISQKGSYQTEPCLVSHQCALLYVFARLAQCICSNRDITSRQVPAQRSWFRILQAVCEQSALCVCVLHHCDNCFHKPCTLSLRCWHAPRQKTSASWSKLYKSWAW